MNSGIPYTSGASAPSAIPGAPELSEILLKELSATIDTFRIMVDRISPFLCAEQQATPMLKEGPAPSRPISMIGGNIRQAIDSAVGLRHEIEAVTQRIDR